MARLIGRLSVFLSAPPNERYCTRNYEDIIPDLSMYHSTRKHIYPYSIHDMIVDARESGMFKFTVTCVKRATDALSTAVYFEDAYDMDPNLAAEWARETIPPLVDDFSSLVNTEQWSNNKILHIVDLDVFLCHAHFKRVHHLNMMSAFMDLMVRHGRSRYSKDTVDAYQCARRQIQRYHGSQRTTQQILHHVSKCTEEYEEIADQPEGLTVAMRRYQRKNLAYMLETERCPDNKCWVRLEFENEEEGEPLYYSPYFIMFRTDVPQPFRGGMLADEMGLGKTITTLSLILANPRVEGTGGTLVCAPVSLVNQWMEEAKHRLNQDLTVYMYHGGNRVRDPDKLKQFDIVVTTYGVISSDRSFSTRRKAQNRGVVNYVPPLEAVQFHRIIFDESHTAKNPATSVFRGCSTLKGTYKWSVTGTPAPMDWTDVVAQLKIIDRDEFKYLLSNARYSNQKYMALICQTMIRHHKNMKVNGVSIIELPECTTNDEIIHLSNTSWEVYNNVKESIAERIRHHHRGVEIMYHLQTLRRLCSAGFEDSNTYSFAMLADEGERERLQQKIAGEVCCVCLEHYDDPVATACRHVFCSECVSSILSSPLLNRCPLCRADISPNTVRRLERPLETTVSDSPKIERMMQMIQRAPFDHKFIVFTQFKATIRRITEALKEANISARSISGSMSRVKRAKNLSEFETMDTVRVFVMSLRSGAVGINLTAANRVIFMEPSFNPGMEKQAIGRAYRIGQTRPVQVHRFVAEGTIDRHILDTRVTFHSDNMPVGRLWSTQRLRRLIVR